MTTRSPSPAPATRDDTRRKICLPRKSAPIPLPAGLAPMRLEAIRLVKNKWVNGTVLHYHFVADPDWAWPEAQKQAVRRAFGTWKQVGIGLEFAETGNPGEAEIRIGFDQNDGSWSFVGTDTLKYSDRGRTMNFGWDLTDLWGGATALHEIGHAIGMPHEHQSPKAGIAWDEEEVYAYFGGAPNYWDRATVFHNILRKLDPAEVEGGNWDPLSIMEYPFAAGLILAPPPYDQGVAETTKLSAEDKLWVTRFYPPLSEVCPIGVMDLQRIDPENGAQRDFAFDPPATRKYTIRTIGRADSKIVVFAERGGEPRYQCADDDSGLATNAEIEMQMIEGVRYTIRVRTHFNDEPDGPGLIIF